jgi:hypothetical protein
MSTNQGTGKTMTIQERLDVHKALAQVLSGKLARQRIRVLEEQLDHAVHAYGRAVNSLAIDMESDDFNPLEYNDTLPLVLWHVTDLQSKIAEQTDIALTAMSYQPRNR